MPRASSSAPGRRSQAASSAGSWPQPRTISARDFVPNTGHAQDQKSGAKILEAVQGLPCHLCPTTASSTAPVGSGPRTPCARASAPPPRKASLCLDAPHSVCPTHPTWCGRRARLSTCISEWLGSVREAPDLLCDPNQVSGPLWALVSLPACWGQALNLRPISLGLSDRRWPRGSCHSPAPPPISSQACFLGGPTPWGLAHMR